MTTEQWLTLATAGITSITAVITPVVKTWAESRIGKANPTPDLNQPTKQIESRVGWIDRVFNSGWFALGQFAIVPFDIWALHGVLANPAPPTRYSAFEVSTLVATIVMCFLNLNSIYIYQTNNTIRRVSDTTMVLSGSILKVSDTTVALSKRIEAQEKPPRTKAKSPGTPH